MAPTCRRTRLCGEDEEHSSSRTAREGRRGVQIELRLEDKKGSAEIFLHGHCEGLEHRDRARQEAVDRERRGAEVDHDRSKVVGNDQSEQIGGNKSIDVAKSRTESIGEDETLSVGGSRSVSVEGGSHRVGRREPVDRRGARAGERVDRQEQERDGGRFALGERLQGQVDERGRGLHRDGGRGHDGDDREERKGGGEGEEDDDHRGRSSRSSAGTPRSRSRRTGT